MAEISTSINVRSRIKTSSKIKTVKIKILTSMYLLTVKIQKPKKDVFVSEKIEVEDVPTGHNMNWTPKIRTIFFFFKWFNAGIDHEI